MIRRLVVVLLLCLSAAGLVGAASRSSHPASPSLAKVIVQPIPARNFYTLANELKLHPPRTISRVVRQKSPNYPVGHVDTFHILGEDDNRYFTTPATIRAKTAHLYIYVQNGVKVSDAAVKKAAQTFESHIYPTDRKYFGSEWTPGVDGDPHITCLVADLRSSSAIGYFSAEDEYPRLVNPYSNQREMVYLNAAITLPSETQFENTLSHEFQHMIHWHMHAHDNGWLNEGMSMVAEKLNGYEPSSEEDAFLGFPETQLNSWAEDGDTMISHYGAAYFFLSYLLNHFGAGVIRDMVAESRYTDLELVNDVLQRHHIGLTADDIFARWVVANYLHDPSIAGGIYDYANLPRRIYTDAPRAVPLDSAQSLSPYSAKYVVIDKLDAVKGPVTLAFSAPASVRLIGETRPAPFWWSNRGDMSDTRLTRTLDLRNVKSATLHYKAWYDIEKDYDYAYVEASADGGHTWTTLRATDSTKSNPYGASYGQAYTGTSKGWGNESVDLSRYAGKKIKLRFQYVTDDVFNGQGLLVKDIAVPQIGFHDTMSGWTQQGFVPVRANSLPAGWHVRLIEYTKSGPHLRSLPLHESGGSYAGSLRITPAKSGLQKVVAVLFFTAPKTTVKLPYHLSASNG